MWRPGAVEFADDLITWVGDPRQTAAGPDTEVRELGGLLMPGLVNCHGHSPMTLVRSAGDGLPLDRWLSESVWPREALHDDDDVFWGMTLGAARAAVQRGDDHLRAVPAPRGGRRRRPGLGHPLRAHARGVRRHRHRPDRHLAGPPGRGLPHLRRDGRAPGAAPRRLRPARRLQPAPGRSVRRGAGGATPRRHGADPPLGDRSRVPGGRGALRHERARPAGLVGCVRRPGARRPRRLAGRAPTWP